ncbi:winged helix-turn-helix domain-containing protein [Falsiroseomonas sp. HW251]|uniref:winged helix-turn-helix domain-containing protein n=1 Tax=Falsiroseomonas sp. HW251 TaxID=3390998 RepID=UPI003D310738
MSATAAIRIEHEVPRQGWRAQPRDRCGSRLPLLRRGNVALLHGQSTPQGDMQGTSPFMGKVRFGCCVLDDGRGTLKAPDGTETVLRPKTLDLLRLLLRNPGRVVARQEILDAVWPNLFVTDDSITQCVVEIRKAIGGAGTDLLKTVPRRGYLMQAEIEIEAANANLPRINGTAMPSDRPSIAVLPFRKDAGDMQEGYFADGIIEGIVHVLSGLERITVVSRSSALALAESTVDPKEVGKRLGVRYALYGGVRRAGDRLRITTELSETETGAIIRSDRYDGDVSDIFALQDRIAEQVVATIAPQVRERELARALRTAPANLTSYDLVLQALDRMHRLDPGNFNEARRLLALAIEADSNDALPRSYAAFWHCIQLSHGASADPLADAREALRLADEAIALDGRDAVALTLRASVIAYVYHEFAEAERLLEQALVASPNCALALAYAAALRCWTGRAQEAVTYARQAVRLTPLDPFRFFYEHILSQALYTTGEFEEALSWGERALAITRHHPPAYRTVICCLVALDRLPEAQARAAELLLIDPGFRVSAFRKRTPLRGRDRDTFAARLVMAGLPD